MTFDQSSTSSESEQLEDQDMTPILRPQQYDLRFTFSDQTSEHEYLEDKGKLNRYKAIAKLVKDKILNYVSNGKLTGGIEVKNKIGEHTRCHCHFRFFSTTKKDTMIKPLKLILQNYDMETKGNKYWYFKILPEQDVDKFWRYPLKETLTPSLCSGFTKDQLTMMAKIANATLQTAIQINQKKQDNRDESDSLFQRLQTILRKAEVKSLNVAITQIIQMYVDEDRPLNKTVIVGYAYTYLVKEKHMTAGALAESWVT